MTTEDCKWGTDHFTHHLLEIREPPPSLVELRNLLQRPEHADILARCNPEASFAHNLGIIASVLDIALDGDYDVDDLCKLLVTCLKGRLNNVSTPHLRAEGLVNAEIQETEDELRLVEAIENTIDPAAGEAWTLYMQRVGCEVCFNTKLCKEEGKCLRLPEEEALKEGEKDDTN